MAIDTAAKRRSVAGLAFFVFGPGVTPDATPGLEWRQQSGWGYSGIAAGEAVASQVRRGPSARGRSRARGRKTVLWWLLILLPGWI